MSERSVEITVQTPPFALNCLNSKWHRSNKMLETILVRFWPILTSSHSWCRFVGSPISMHPKGALLNWGLVTVRQFEYTNSFSHSQNQIWVVWGLWHGTLSLWKQPLEDYSYTVVIKKRVCSSVNLWWAVAFKRFSLGTKELKICHENIPHTIAQILTWTLQQKLKRHHSMFF